MCPGIYFGDIQIGGVSPPATPTSLTANAVDGTKINVTWDAMATATGYTLQSSLDNATWGTIYTGANTGFANTGLSTSTQVFYRVLATNGGGSSAYSSSVNTTTFSAALAVISNWAFTVDGSDSGPAANNATIVSGTITGSGLQCSGSGQDATALDTTWPIASASYSFQFDYTAVSGDLSGAHFTTFAGSNAASQAVIFGIVSGQWDANQLGADFPFGAANTSLHTQLWEMNGANMQLTLDGVPLPPQAFSNSFTSGGTLYFGGTPLYGGVNSGGLIANVILKG